MTKLFRIVVFGLAFFLWLQLISLYLTWPEQMILGGASVVLGIAVNRFSASRLITLGLMLISITATFRYGWWRLRLLADYFADGSNHRFGFDAFLMLLLISAEGYTFLIMVLGYMQTAWPLQRTPILLPNDESLWPHVDVLIPTYNEPLSLVRYTALAAINIDYPPDKLHVYILDDGTREEFEEFAAQAGVGYIIRDIHQHAKAGNINHALTTMDSPYVAIFDCDHVPTRSFLQMTLGWMLADKKLAMLQTPHHFYSPDPFERNLLQYKTIPSEAELFYGIVQDGNDFWNATFFCGSCAVIRRSALDEVGGIAVETVTEDAHTSLRMQKLGYNTAYINIPQAAGLATETLAAHVGQRIRWARGMIQIFRVDNPLLARGLKFTQRLCYLNAMIHFLYAVPRLIFLCAPLVYMLLGRSIIPGYWLAILAFSLPHLILASLTNSRIQSRHRHSFWNEIYEAVLAPYILAPTLLALINPKLGKFNVTDKGRTLNSTRFDRKIARPTRWLLFLNFLGLVITPYRIFVNDPHHPGTVIMNLAWILFNMVILGVAAAVAHEQKQRRGSVRIEAKIPVRLDLPDGLRLHTVSIDMSVGGASVKLPPHRRFSVGDEFRLAFPDIAGDADIGVRVAGVRDAELRLEFSIPTIQEQETLTRALYSRADAWLTSIESKEADQPLKSLGRVVVLSLHGFYQILRSLLPEKSPARTGKSVPAASALILLGLLGGSLLLKGSTPPPQTAPPAFASNQDLSSPDSPIKQVIRLKDMGAIHPIEFRGPHSYSSVRFILPHTIVPHQSTLTLRYSFDPALDAHATSLKVTLNGSMVAALSPRAAGNWPGQMDETKIAVPANQLVRSNTLSFEFTGSGLMMREDQAQASILAHLSPESSIEVDGDRLRLKNDLGQLPLPVFDSELQTPTTIPFAFLGQPTPKVLEAAGMVASWFGIAAGSTPARFAVSVGEIPKGDVVLFSDQRSNLPGSFHLPAGEGPILAIRDNPSDPMGSVLVVAGNDEEALITAARALSLANKASFTAPASGLPANDDTTLAPVPLMPPPRNLDDAPRWLPLTRDAPLANCSSQEVLQTGDSNSIPVYFHVPPDAFYGERENLKLQLHYRYNGPSAGPGSALRVVVNGQLVNETQLTAGDSPVERTVFVSIPVAVLQPFGNTMLFNFDFAGANSEAGQDSDESPPVKGEVFCDSSLDLHGLARWTRMPNLEIFANSGFPFTRRADLAETAVILPTVPSRGEMALYLDLMGQFGAQTGYPGLRLTVAGPNVVLSSNKDYLVLGTAADQPAFHSLAGSVPVTLDRNGVHVKESGDYFSTIHDALLFWWSKLTGTPFTHLRPANDRNPPAALIQEIESPSSPDRSLVLIVLRSDEIQDAFSNAFLDKSLSSDVKGAVSLLQAGKFESYAMNGATYQTGAISWFALMRLWLTRYFLLLLVVVTVLNLVVASWIREWLSRRAQDRLRLAETAEAVN
jgi:cellulose synthase (UDP-forming)